MPNKGAVDTVFTQAVDNIQRFEHVAPQARQFCNQEVIAALKGCHEGFTDQPRHRSIIARDTKLLIGVPRQFDEFAQPLTSKLMAAVGRSLMGLETLIHLRVDNEFLFKQRKEINCQFTRQGWQVINDLRRKKGILAAFAIHNDKSKLCHEIIYVQLQD